MKTGKFKTEDEYLREEAIRFLVSHMPRSASDKKPVILHSIRVGTYLQNMGCSLDSVIGGYLHDLIEDSSITADHISEKFGNNIATIVLANSKDPTITKQKRLGDCIERCKQYGIDALYVKAADIIDNYNFYTQKKSKSEKLRASKQGSYLLKLIKNEAYRNDLVFRDLYEILEE